MVRFRLRFLLQEIDLPQGETLLGRSTSCHLTFEDPLVSRQHARIVIRGEYATIEDLGSRNGLQIAGRTIRGVHELTEGDRIRVGTQELVFCRVQAPNKTSRSSNTRSTGFLCYCAACGVPYPTELAECPSCGASERSDDDTMSGVDSQRNWSLELLADVVKKALALRRWDDAERVLERARANIEHSMSTGRPVDAKLLEPIAEAAAALALARSNARWGSWLLGIYATLGALPPNGVIERLSALPEAQRTMLAAQMQQVVAAARARGESAAEELERTVTQIHWVPDGGRS